MDTSMIEATQALEFDDDYEDTNENDQDGNRIVGHLNVPCQKGFPGKQYPITEGDNVIGRGDHCSIYIPLKGLSREHACIEVKGENHFIYDKGSRNKTKRNNFFLSTHVRYELKDGDKLIFGDVNCSYRIGEQVEDNDDTGSETGSESMFETAPSVSVNGFTILETPAQPKVAKRLMDNLTIPESDSEPDDDLTKTVTTLEADTQDTSAVNLMGAPTQAFVCDSDVTTDDDDSPKKSILTAATQAYNMDIGSSDEDSPSKRSLLSAATQAFVADSDESSPKKAKKIEPTLKYDMPEVIEATQGYDMEGDTEGENEEDEDGKQLFCQATQAFKQDNEGEGSDIETGDEKDETNKSKLMLQPTQTFFGDKQKDKENDEVQSESSEDFVLEGDTDNEEDSEAAKNMFAAPTLACIDDVTDDIEMNNDQTAEVEDKTLAVCNEATQAIVDKTNEPDATVAVEEDATQMVVDKLRHEATVAVEKDTTQAITDMETQIVADVCSNKGNNHGTDATQLLEDVVTQVFNNDATQVLQQTSNVDTSSDTQTSLPGLDSKTEKTVDDSEMATQVLEDAVTQVVGKEEPSNLSKSAERQDSGSFDITAASTLAPSDSIELSLEPDRKDNDATQVFDNVDIEEGNLKNMTERETQVFDNATSKVGEETQTMAVTDDTVPLVSETVPVSDTLRDDGNDKTLPVTDDVKDTVAISGTMPVSDTAPITNTIHISDTDPLTETVPIPDPIVKQTVPVSDTVPVNGPEVMETIPIDSTIDTDKMKVDENEMSGVIRKKDTEDDYNAKNARKRRVKRSYLNKGENKDSDSEATCEHQEADTNDDRKSTSTRRGRGKRNEESAEVIDIPTVDQDEGTDSVPVEQPAKASNRRGNRGKATVIPDETVKSNNTNQRKSRRTQKSENSSSVKAFDDSEHNLVQEENSVDSANKSNENSAKDSELDVKNTSRSSRSRTKNKENALVQETGQDKVTSETVSDESRDKAQSKTGRGTKSKKTVEPVNDVGPEPATQAYFEEPATQMHKDSPKKGNREEEPTQRFGDDNSTQSLSQIEDEESNSLMIPKPAIVSIPSRSPLKSAMASPEKKKSPSPKRVQFLSQNSDNTASTSDKQGNIVESSVNESKSEKGKQTQDEKRVKSSRKRKSVLKDNLKNDSASSTSEIQSKSINKENGKSLSELGEQSEMDVAEAPRRIAREKAKDIRKIVEIPQNQNKSEDIIKDDENGSLTNDQIRQTSKIEQKTRRKTKSDLIEKKEETNEKQSNSRSRKRQAVKEKEEFEKEKSIMTETIKDAKEEGQTHLESLDEKGDTASEISKVCGIDTEVLKHSRPRRGTSSETKDTVNVEEKSQRKRKSVTQETSEAEIKSEQNNQVLQAKSKSRRQTKTDPLETVEENTSEKTKPSRSGKKARGHLEKDVFENDNKKENLLESKLKKQSKSDLIQNNSRSGIIKENSEELVVNPDSRRSRRTKSDVNKELETESTGRYKESHKTDPVKGNKKMTKVDESVTDNSEGKEAHQNQRRGRKTKDVENKDIETENTDEEKSDEINTMKGKKIADDKVSKNSAISETKQDARKSGRNINVAKTDVQDSVTSDGKDAKQDARKSKRTKDNVKENLETEIETDQPDSHISDKKVNVQGKRKTRNKIDKVNSDSKEGASDKSGEKARTNVKLDVSENDKIETATSKTDSAKNKVGFVKMKEIKESEATTKSVVGRRGGKRKGTDDSALDSTDLSQNDEGTPAKKQKLKDASTPKSSTKTDMLTPRNTSKQVASSETPKSKPLDTSVTESPTLRKTTTSSLKPKVMFTGVTDEQGEKIVKELGGELVSSVTECTHLVTDQIRRTVKFLCCLARGIPIISPQWLISSKKCGFFSDTATHLIQDDASEKKFKCNLQQSLTKASDGPMLEGYKIHVTKSVKPPPDQMKDILKCAGAQVLTAMPKSSSPTTLVISCEDDKSQCDTAVKNGITVVNAEFVLTGILRQEVDVHSYILFRESQNKKASSQEPASKKRKR